MQGNEMNLRARYSLSVTYSMLRNPVAPPNWEHLNWKQDDIETWQAITGVELNTTYIDIRKGIEYVSTRKTSACLTLLQTMWRQILCNSSLEPRASNVLDPLNFM